MNRFPSLCMPLVAPGESPRRVRDARVHRGLPALLILAVASGGCASSSSDTGSSSAPAPQRTSVRVGGYQPLDIYTEAGVGTRTLAAGAQTAWQALPAVFEQLGIPVEELDGTNMALGTPGFLARRIGRDRMNTFVDCGSDLAGPLANQYDVTLSVQSRVTSKGPQSTELTTVVDAHARPRAVSGNRIHCQSRGRLEERVADVLEQVLASGSL